VVDDAQHADEGTIAFVEHLLTNAEFPAFVVLMSRPGLLQRWPDLATNRRATVLHLATLDDAEMAELLDGLVSGLPFDVRDGLVERAQGVPLYAIETVRSLIDRDLVVPRGGVYVLADPAAVDLAAIGAPASLHALVAARLDGLPADQRRVVADASVLGNTFTREAITALASDLPNLDDTLAALVRAEVLGLVTSRLSAEYGQYRFVQDVVRQVAYNTQSKRDRKTRHLAVAEYFDTLPDPAGDFAPVLAQHYLDAIESSGAGDADLAELRESAIRSLRGAASRARALGAPGDALRYLESALSLQPDESATAELRLLAASAATDAVRADEAEAHARAALAYYEGVGDVLRAGEAAAALAIVLAFLRSDLAGALAVAQPPWETLQGVRGAEQILLELARSMTSAQLGLNTPDPALGHARLAIAEATGDRLAIADALNALGLLTSRTSPVYARLLFRACVDLAREEQRPVIAGKGLMNLALLSAVNDLVAANAISDEALDEMRRAGTQPYQLQMQIGNRSALALEMGQLDLASELAAAMDAEVAPGAYIAPFVHGALADVRGESELLSAPGDEVRSADDKSVMSLVAGADMFAAKRAGDLPKAARKGLEAALSQYEVSGFTDDLVHIWPFAMSVALSAGEREVVDRLLEIVDDEPPGFVGVGVRAHRKRVAALLAAQDGRDDVESLLRSAVDEYTAWGSPLWAARARAELAAWLTEQGRVDEAAVLRRQATDQLRGAGANGWLTELGLVEDPVASGAEVS
jgi:tetratricopeptide (TPR) repeat protein